MRKIILFIFISIFSNASDCCSYYGDFVDNGKIDGENYVKDPDIDDWIPARDTVASLEGDIIISDVLNESNKYYVKEVCKEKGISDIWKADNYYLYRGENIYNCTCTEENTTAEPLDASQWNLIASGNSCSGSDQTMPSECYEADGINYMTQSHREDCCIVTECYAKVQNPYDCTQKGEGWENHPNVDQNECLDYANQPEWDQASWESGSDYDDTCCLHANPDNNDTQPQDDNNSNPDPEDNNNSNDGEGGGDNDPDPNTCSDAKSNFPDYSWVQLSGSYTSSGCSNAREDPDNQRAFLDQDNICCIGTPSNNGDNGDTDNNTTGSNSDTDAILAGINSDINTNHDETMDKMDESNEILNGIRSDIQTGSAQNHSDLGVLTDTVSDASNRNHEDLSNLGSTLDDIKNNTDYLNELRDQADNTDNSLDNFSNALTEANANYDSVLNAFTGLASSYTNAPPTFTGTGDHVFSTSVYGRTVSFDLGMFADLKPYFDILFALMLAYFNFRIYRWIFEFLVKIGAS